jgi:hypothetical protein
MAMNEARKRWLKRMMSAAERAIELHNDMESLSAEHFANFYGDVSAGILDEDLQNFDDFKHLTKAELDTLIVEVNAILVANGSLTDGNTLLGAAIKVIG